MQLAEITNEFVESCLRSMRTADLPNQATLELCLLQSHNGQSPEARLLHLQDLLTQLVENAYSGQRQAEMLAPNQPANRQGILDQLRQDFNCNNSDLESWSALYHRYLTIIPLSVEELSAAASVVPQQFRRRLNQGFSFLAQKLRRLELQAQQARQPVARSMPLPDFTHLIGAEASITRLSAFFNDPHGPQLVSLEGMGGIGKTALARAFVALPETAHQWKNILWVSARQYFLGEDGHMAALAEPASTLDDITARLVEQLGMSHLAARPAAERLDGIQAALSMDAYLVVIDNLETVDEYIQLVPALAKCAGKSRLLITTRQTLRQFSYVQTLQLAELNFQSACELMRSENARRGRTSDLPKQVCEELYQLVGGIPLAIKLVAAQLPLWPLGEILEGFRSARGSMDTLYRYLYWQTWQLLSDSARRLLLSFLPADPEGEDLTFIQVMSGQPEDTFFLTLQELDQFSLLEISGDAHAPRYRLHRLTVTFLQTDILSSWSETP